MWHLQRTCFVEFLGHKLGLDASSVNVWISEVGVLFLHHMLLCIHWGGVLAAGQPYCMASCAPIVLKAQWDCQTPMCPQAPTSSTPHLALAAAPMTPHPLLLLSPATPTAACIPHIATVYSLAPYHTLSNTQHTGSRHVYFSICYADLMMHVHYITSSCGTWHVDIQCLLFTRDFFFFLLILAVIFFISFMLSVWPDLRSNELTAEK